MQDHLYFPSRPGRRFGGGRVGGLHGVGDIASWAIALLAARRSFDHPPLRHDLVEAFRTAATDPDDEALHAFLARLLRERVSATSLADTYIPALARRLGQDWLDDCSSFAEVSLATARLQAMLRAIGSAWSADTAQPGGTGAVLLLVPRPEQHTLGALVLLGQLRRMGVTVRLMLWPQPGEVGQAVRQAGLQGAMISVSCPERLAEVRGIVKEIRNEGPPGLPVVLGGVVLDRRSDAAQATGADLATADLDAALAACGIEFGAGRIQRRA